MTVATTFVDNMISIASPTSGGRGMRNITKELNNVFCVPASSALVERVFSYGGIIWRPQHARLTDDVLSSLSQMQCACLVLIKRKTLVVLFAV